MYQQWYIKFQNACKHYNKIDSEDKKRGFLSFPGAFDQLEKWSWEFKDYKIIWKDFEFLKIPVPSNYHDILTITYGNYIKISILGRNLCKKLLFVKILFIVHYIKRY